MHWSVLAHRPFTQCELVLPCHAAASMSSLSTCTRTLYAEKFNPHRRCAVGPGHTATMPAAWAALVCALLCLSSMAEGHRLRKGRHLQVGNANPRDSVFL